jgi:hypothetical protein
MKDFPDLISVENRSEFADIYYERIKCYLRRDLYEHILKIHKTEYDPKKNQDYFSVDSFDKRWMNDRVQTKRMIEELISELQSKGWTCKLSFGDSGLFIYTGSKPANLFDGEEF